MRLYGSTDDTVASEDGIDKLRKEVDIVIGNPINRQRDTDAIMALVGVHVAAECQQARAEGLDMGLTIIEKIFNGTEQERQQIIDGFKAAALSAPAEESK